MAQVDQSHFSTTFRAAWWARPEVRWGFWGLCLAFAVFYPFLFSRPFLIRMGILVLLWSLLGLAWNLIGGYGGQVSLGHAVFFGLGAYTSTVLLTKWHISPWIGMLVGGLVAAVAAVVIGWPTFRLQGHYFAIATIAAGEIFAILFRNWEWVGGAVGIYLPLERGDRLLAFQFHESKVPYYYIVLALLLLAIGVSVVVERSRIGYYLRALKADQDAARSLGVPITRYKLYAMVLSAVLTAFGGTFYAQYVLYISPNTVFALMLSVQMCLVAVLGGLGTVAGPIIGAVVLIPLAEYTRVWLGGRGGGLHLVVYGLLIVLISVVQPAGVMGIWRNLVRQARRSRVVSVPAEETA